MNNDPLNEREFELVNIIGGQLAANQRDLSRQMNLSLGMTNMLIRRLVTKGYIRISQLNQRKVQYILTPKGFAEKMSKSISYTLKTINSIGLVKKQLFKILQPLHAQGIKEFYVLGESDLAFLIDMVLREHFIQDFYLQRIKNIEDAKETGIVLICVEKFPIPSHNTVRHVKLIEEMAKVEMDFQEDVLRG